MKKPFEYITKNPLLADLLPGFSPRGEPKRRPRRNPAGTKLIKKFIKASRKEFPPYVRDLQRLAPKDPLIDRFVTRD